MNDSNDVDDAEVLPGPAVTAELFLAWRSPRLGNANPDAMTNPVWEWLVKSRIDTYQANKRFNGPSPFDAGPGWCFDRFGQSSTPLPDGRVVLIAGEHEDYYDPDFYIYNDVVIQHPDGRIDIFGYPREIFPATDFHSATLVGNKIVLVGNLGYHNERRYGTTQVRVLDLESLTISTVQTSGTSPGWIHEHKATLADDGRAILLERGKVDRSDEEQTLVENIDDWKLHLDGWRWERLTDRRWPRWEVRRCDRESNHLFGYQQAVWAQKYPQCFDDKLQAELQAFQIPTLEEELGRAPDLDLFARLYKPPVQHEHVADSEDEFKIHRIKVDGVVVRYVEDSAIQITVEGELPAEKQDTLVRDLVDKLSALENSQCESVVL